MDLNTTLIVSVAGGLAVDLAIGKSFDAFLSVFKSGVIDRWSRNRAEEFVRTFCRLVANDAGEDDVKRHLEEIVNDDAKSAALFDAYRRVALSSSPILGPRIIAIVMAKIVGQSRRPSRDEEQILLAAERLTDDELLELSEWWGNHESRLEKGRKSYVDRGEPDNGAGIDFWNDWGSWAGKLATLGFVTEFVSIAPLYYERGGLKYETSIKSQMISNIHYSYTCKDLVGFIDSARKMADQ